MNGVITLVVIIVILSLARGPYGFICKYIYPSADTETERALWKALAGCDCLQVDRIAIEDINSKPSLGTKTFESNTARQPSEFPQNSTDEYNSVPLLWRHYIKIGQFDEAGKVLKQEYEKNPKDTNTLKGLLFLAEMTTDKQAVTKYGEELLSVEETADNHLLFVQACLNTGLIKEAEQKLASFRERYPQDDRESLLATYLSMKQGGKITDSNETSSTKGK